MNNLEIAQKAVEEAEAKLKEAKEALNNAKKQERISLKIPVEFSHKEFVYYNDLANSWDYESTQHLTKEGCLSSFASTNKTQAKAFAEALQVMAELRCQEGIVIPNKQCFTIKCNSDAVWFEDFKYYSAQLIFPAYASEHYAQKAIDNVGKERIIEAYKTLLFMTPESRGEILND